MWNRYRGGMLAGVVWAARMDAPLPERVAMARHIVGTALHPLQAGARVQPVPARPRLLPVMCHPASPMSDSTVC